MAKPERDFSGRIDDGNAAPGSNDEDSRAALADQREADLDAREVRAELREAELVDRRERATRILVDADKRDDQAEARDAAAAARDRAASLRSFLHDDEDDYGPALKARRSAALDRTDSKTDRQAAAADRSELAEDNCPPRDGDSA